MRIVPRQLQRSGMTGNVPYYGGRLSPAQAYAASHPTAAGPPPGVPAYSGRMSPAQTTAMTQYPGGTPGVVAQPSSTAGDLEAVRRLAASGVITPEELAAIERRMS